MWMITVNSTVIICHFQSFEHFQHLTIIKQYCHQNSSTKPINNLIYSSTFTNDTGEKLMFDYTRWNENKENKMKLGQGHYPTFSSLCTSLLPNESTYVS